MRADIEIQLFQSLTLFGLRWYFRAVDTGNHEILFPSQAYKSRAARNKTANRLAYALGCNVTEGKRK